MSWDRDGDLLAALNNKSNSVTLWDANTRRSTNLDSSMGLKYAKNFLQKNFIKGSTDTICYLSPSNCFSFVLNKLFIPNIGRIV